MSFDEICVLREPIYESLDKELKKEEKKLKETKSSQQQKKGATKSWGSWIRYSLSNFNYKISMTYLSLKNTIQYALKMCLLK